MKILFALTYYRPHVSGLTIYVERLARAMASRGHEVTVLTSQYDKSLPKTEVRDGVRVMRAPVLLRISKGVIMPTFPWLAYHLIRQNDVLSVHLPQLEASLLTFISRFLVRRPVVLTYHCDLQLPPGAFNRIVDRMVFVSNYLAGLLSDKIVAYTWDYAEHSPYLSKFKGKVRVIYPPVEMPSPSQAECEGLVRDLGLDGKRVIGFAARFAAEKGVEYLLGAIPYILEEIPDLKVLFAGEYKNVIGEEAYFRRLEPLIQRYQDHLAFLGVLAPQAMANFFSACDCLVLSSVNSTESFGLVQVEAMLCGTPVVASELPGVREPVRVTGMGETVPIRDERALAEAVVKVIKNREAYVRPRRIIAQTFDLARTVDQYEALFGGESEALVNRA